MSRWRAAPPSSGAVMDWDQKSVRVDTTMPYNRLSHYSSPLSLSAYRLISPISRGSSPSALSPQSHDPHSTPPSPRPSRAATQSPTLPYELYRQIVQYITSPHDLCTLARVSRSFQAEAERVLYHSLHLRHHIKTLWRCETLATQPRLARYVRKLSIIIDQYTPLDSIARALQACRNLRSLTLRGAPWSDYSRVLDSVSSTEIRELTCHARGEAGVVRFLERQRCLEVVDLEAHAFDMDNLSPQAAAALQSFTGCLVTAARLVPGRPVRQLTLISDMANDATIRAVTRLAEGQGDIQALDIRMGVLRNPISWTILQSVFTSLRGVRFLGVCSLDCARHPSFPYYIMGLPHLQTLVFGTGTDDYGKYDERVQLELVTRLGQSCESLTQVIISLAVWKHDWIWTRDASHTMEWNQNWRAQGQEWWGMLSSEPINLEELARLHVEPASS